MTILHGKVALFVQKNAGVLRFLFILSVFMERHGADGTQPPNELVL